MRRPIAVAAAAFALGALFVALRLASFDGDATRFVTAGDHFTDPGRVTGDVYVLPDSTGYDGQYFYRLALDPLTDQPTADGITFVAPAYNQQRIAYPLLAWVLSFGGRTQLVPWALIVVNLAALFGLAYAAARLAQLLGRPPIWGLVIALYPGFWITLGRDLTELVAGAFVVSGLVMWRRNGEWPAALLFTAAMLARETTIIIPVALAVTQVIKRRRLPTLATMTPLLATAAWQAFLWQRWGTTGPGAGTAAISTPLRGINFALRYQLGRGDDPAGFVLAGSLILFTLAALFFATRRGRALAHERVALLIAAVVLLSASKFVWVYDSGFLRAGTETWILGATIILGLTRGGETVRRDLAWATGGVSAVVAALHLTGV